MTSFSWVWRFQHDASIAILQSIHILCPKVARLKKKFCLRELKTFKHIKIENEDFEVARTRKCGEWTRTRNCPVVPWVYGSNDQLSPGFMDPESNVPWVYGSNDLLSHGFIDELLSWGFTNPWISFFLWIHNSGRGQFRNL